MCLSVASGRAGDLCASSKTPVYYVLIVFMFFHHMMAVVFRHEHTLLQTRWNNKKKIF